MAAPSRHPLPPASLALSLPDKAGQRRGPGRGCRGAPRKGRPGRQGRDAGRVALALGLWTLTVGLSTGRGGGCGRKWASPAQPRGRWGRTRQEQPPPRGQRTPTWPVTHSQDTQSWVAHAEMRTCACAHTHRVHRQRNTPSSHKAQTYTAHMGSHSHAHTVTYVHTYPAPPAQDLTHTACTHSDAHRWKDMPTPSSHMQTDGHIQPIHRHTQAHRGHTQTHSYIPRYIVHIHGHTKSFSL